MIFATVPIAQAEGCYLAHSLQGANGRIAKGTELGAAELADLAAAGHQDLTVARLEPGDLHEDDAARRLAQALLPDPAAYGLRISGAGAGRVNLHALGPGVVRVQADRINALNAVNPMITLATVPDFHRADAGSMVATAKIISYAVPEAALQRATRDVAGAIRLAPVTLRRAVLIETRVTDDIPSDKGRAAIVGRLDRFAMALAPRQVVAHRVPDLAAAMTAAVSAPVNASVDDQPGCDLIMVLTGSATSDAQDVAPSALRAAGGQMVRFGMPVDPGNLLFLGQLAGRPVLGLPGCARSIALNGADWVLERLVCGLEVRSEDIAGLGVGGLLKEIPTRPRPRHQDGT
ncbi:molybdopterin-binding protein [Phaeobacter sp.]|uniref:molybdopterin-binding protein n=1 Tax=Phaeobacter sp. TaxID=1902409 RepID=UPI0025E21343|nr:molybdopterin-binding protein [Phaeobacter sp.]